MTDPSRRRWLEAALALVAALVGLLTAVVPTWFEQVLGASPDGGDGSAERWFALLWFAGSAVLALLARRDHRLALAAEAP